MKIITICGSYKYKSEMISVYQQLTDLGYIVLFPAMGCEGHDKKWYLELHTEKIAMSDAIFVVDVNHYIGLSLGGQRNRLCGGLSAQRFYDSGAGVWL